MSAFHMFEIHRGKGAIAVILSGIFSGLIMQAATRALFDRHYYSAHVWPLFGSFWLAGLLCIAAGAYLRKYPTRVLGRGWFTNEAADHFFFIPVVYWGPIYFAAGIIYLVVALR